MIIKCLKNFYLSERVLKYAKIPNSRRRKWDKKWSGMRKK